jgi:hypothetical protein
MKVGTVRIHGTEEVLQEVKNAFSNEDVIITKNKSYIEFVLPKEDMNEENIYALRLLSAQEDIYGVEIYRGVKYHEPISDCFMNIYGKDKSEEELDFIFTYFEGNDIDKEYFTLINSPQYKAEKELKKIASYEKKLEEYKKRVIASVK